MPYVNGAWQDEQARNSSGWLTNPWGVAGTGSSTPTRFGSTPSYSAMVSANPAAFGLSRTRPTGTTGSGTTGMSVPLPAMSSLMGTPGSGGSNTPYGTVPTVPDPNATTASAIGGNLRNLGSIFDLGSRTNEFTQGQLHGSYVSELGPEYEPSVQQAMTNLYSNLKGEIPAEVMRQFQQDAAERGAAGGMVGSGNVDSAYLTNVLRNRLALQKQGAELLSDRIRTTPIAEQFKPGQFMVSPEDMFNAQMAANMYAAAPNPAMAAAAQRQALNQGVNYGAGAGGGAGPGFVSNFGMPNINWGGGGPTVGQSTGTGTMYGGVAYQGTPTNPNTLGTAWQNWASSIAPQWNSTVGGYINPQTGGLSDTPNGPAWPGFSWAGVNTPAVDENAMLWNDWLFYGGGENMMPGANEIDYTNYYGGAGQGGEGYMNFTNVGGGGGMTLDESLDALFYGG